MQIVVSDTTPIRYLAAIDLLHLLPQLFETIHIPDVVYGEIQRSATPPQVRNQILSPPAWLKIVTPEVFEDHIALLTLDEGERAALALGLQLNADLILIDERKGAAIARQKGLEITGTLGILVRAARRNVITLEDAFARLRNTTFHCSEDLMNSLLAEHNSRKP